MSLNNTRLYFYVILFISAMFVFYILMGGYDSIDENTIDCAEGHDQGMSGDEIAELFELPIVQISSIPNIMKNEPRIRLAIDYPMESDVCGLEILYLSQHDNTIQISIKIFDASGLPSDWSCIDFEEENNRGLGSFRSVCSRTMEIEERKVFLRIYSQEVSDITLQLANDLEWLGN